MSRATGIKSPAVLARESRRSGTGGNRRTPATDYNCGPTTTTGGGWRAEHGLQADGLDQRINLVDAGLDHISSVLNAADDGRAYGSWRRASESSSRLRQRANCQVQAVAEAVDGRVQAVEVAVQDVERALTRRRLAAELGGGLHVVVVGMTSLGALELTCCVHVVFSKAARTRAACGVWSLEPVGLVRSQVNLAHVDGYPKGNAKDGKGEDAEGGGHGSAHHPAWRRWHGHICGLPHMQAEGMQVHVVAAGWVVLNHALVITPEQLFDVAHLFPGGAALWQADADVLPAPAIAANHLEGQRRSRVRVFNEEHAVVAVGFITGHGAMTKAELLRCVHSHTSALHLGGLALGGSAKHRPINVGAEVFAADHAFRGALNGWATLGRNWPITLDPLVDGWGRYANQPSHCGLTPNGHTSPIDAVQMFVHAPMIRLCLILSIGIA